MLRLGIVGLPNVGKSTLFNALTSSNAAAAENYPFCTVEPNVGVVEVPDARLEKLNQVVRPKRKVPAVVEFVDIAGLVKGASQGEALGDLAVVERRLEKTRKTARAGDKDAQAELALLERVVAELNAGRGAREAGEGEQAIRLLRQL